MGEMCPMSIVSTSRFPPLTCTPQFRGFDEENVSIEIPVYLVYRTHDHMLGLEANKELLARRALGFVCHLEPARAFSLSADT
jgi:hypothetical protein